MTKDQVTGRRQRNMQLNHERIFTAAAELFAERGFEATTTREVAERAGVAAGTVFRYAASKSELLLMVYNRKLAEAIARGAAEAATRADGADAVETMVISVFDASTTSPENSAAYQRELLFGPASERFRAEGLALVSELESMIRMRLIEDRPGLDDRTARLVAASAFAVLHLAISRSSTGAHPGSDARQDLRDQLHLLLAGPTTHIRTPDATEPSERNQS